MQQLLLCTASSVYQQVGEALPNIFDSLQHCQCHHKANPYRQATYSEKAVRCRPPIDCMEHLLAFLYLHLQQHALLLQHQLFRLQMLQTHGSYCLQCHCCTVCILICCLQCTNCQPTHPCISSMALQECTDSICMPRCGCACCDKPSFKQFLRE